MLLEFSVWLAGTPLSQLLQSVVWIIPAIQSVHILAVAVVMGSIWMINMKAMGIGGKAYTMTEVMARFTWPIWVSLCILFVTGLTLLVAEPERDIRNPAFWLKMALLLVAICLTAFFERTASRDSEYWSAGSQRQLASKVLGGLALFVWIAIAVCGRWIAYVESAA